MKQIWKKHAAFSAGVMLAASALSGIPAAPVSAAELLTAEFETTNDSFTGRGGASVQWTSDESKKEHAVCMFQTVRKSGMVLRVMPPR